MLSFCHTSWLDVASANVSLNMAASSWARAKSSSWVTDSASNALILLDNSASDEFSSDVTFSDET